MRVIVVKQHGAAGIARRAHNPEVPRSKRGAATFLFTVPLAHIMNHHRAADICACRILWVKFYWKKKSNLGKTCRPN
jgi:hypothetical protein